MKEYAQMIQRASDASGLPAQWISAIIDLESKGNPNAKSPKGAQGLMQLMPGTAQQEGVQNAYDPAENILGGSKYFAELLTKYKDPVIAAAAYNAGPGAVDKYGGIPPYKETKNYAKKFAQMIGGNMGGGGDITNKNPQRGMGPTMPGMESGTGALPAFQGKGNKGGSNPFSTGSGVGGKIGTILAGLSNVAASFNPRIGYQLQPQMAQQNAEMQQLAQAQKASKQTSTLALLKLLQGDPTNEMRNFSAAGKNPDFLNFIQKTRPGYDPLSDMFTDNPDQATSIVRKIISGLQPQPQQQPQAQQPQTAAPTPQGQDYGQMSNDDIRKAIAGLGL